MMDYGSRYAALRVPIVDPKTHVYVRTTEAYCTFHRANSAKQPVQPGPDAVPH